MPYFQQTMFNCVYTYWTHTVNKTETTKGGLMSVHFSEKIIEKAKTIATECQGHNKAYCSSRCPMHTDAIGYIDLIRQDKLDDAIALIREKLFLPGSLGRICAHPCETECRSNKEFKAPLSIAALKRYAADNADDEKKWDLSKKEPSGKKVAVIGAGPAGAQAAIDLAKEGHAVTVYEALPYYGGMMRVGIPAYRLPKKVIDFEYSYLEKLGIKFVMNTKVGVDISFSDVKNLNDAVVVAMGAHKGSVIPSKGGDCENITNAVDFLKKAALEEKADVPCKKVVVIGGGDVAMDCARTALRLGAEKVTLVSLESLDILPASKHEQEGALEEGIEFSCGYGNVEFASKEEDGKKILTSATFQECLCVFDDEKKFNPQYGDCSVTFECDTVIFATGQITEKLEGCDIEQARNGRFTKDALTLETSLEGVFVAGDCAGTVIVVEAMASGRKAAYSVNRFLKKEALDSNRNFSDEVANISKLEIPMPKDYISTPRKHTRMMLAADRIKTFDECDFGFDKETATEEASRCMKCECKKCMIECIMLNDFTTYPGELFTQFMSAKDMDPVIPYSCNMCDQCTLVCPEEYKFSELFGLMRKDYIKANNGNSPMKGHKAINMHQFLGFSSFFTTKRKGS